MGLMSKSAMDAMPKWIPSTKKGETARYEASCQSVVIESCETARGQVAAKYEFTFALLSTFPDGDDIEQKYGLTPAESPIGKLVWNTEENEEQIADLCKLLRWNGKEGGDTVCKTHVVLTVTSLAPKAREKGGGYWPGKITIEDIDAMPSPADLMAHRAKLDEIKRKMAATIGTESSDIPAQEEMSLGERPADKGPAASKAKGNGKNGG